MRYLYTRAAGENNLALSKTRNKWEFVSPHTVHMTLSSIRHLQYKWLHHMRTTTNTHATVSLQTRWKWHCEQEFVSQAMRARSQQQANDDCWLTGVLALILMLARGSPADDAAGPTRDLISAAIVTNACSTLVAFFALVSRNGMRSWSAYSCRRQTRDTHAHRCLDLVV